MVTCPNQLINSKHLQRFPEPSKWSLSLVHRATQSWGRLLIWQLFRRQSLTPLQIQSTVSKHVNRKLSGRKKCGRKRCTTSRENRSLMRIVKQNWFKNLGELHKEWTEAGVKASRATTHRRVKEFGYSCRQRRLTWAKEKKNWTVAQWSKVLVSDESKFYISFGNQGPRVWRKGGEAHSPSCLKSSVKFSQSEMIWGAMSSAGVGPLCWSIVSLHPFAKKFWSTSYFLLLTSFLKMLISFSSRIW